MRRYDPDTGRETIIDDDGVEHDIDDDPPQKRVIVQVRKGRNGHDVCLHFMHIPEGVEVIVQNTRKKGNLCADVSSFKDRHLGSIVCEANGIGTFNLTAYNPGPEFWPENAKKRTVPKKRAKKTRKA